MTLPYLQHGPDDATGVVIMLHGLGASAEDLAPLAGIIGRPDWRFIFPQAPTRPVTVNGGYLMSAWYDILSLDIERKLNTEHLQEVSTQLQALLEQQRQSGAKVVLAGFSQGGAVAYQAALTSPQPLAGLLSMSTYLAAPVTIHPAQQQLRVAIHHGRQDQVVPPLLGQRAHDTLRRSGLPVQQQHYDSGHEITSEQVQDIATLLTRWLGHDA